MMKTLNIESRKDLATVLILMAIVAIYRVLPHPYNFAPATALAIFGGVCFRSRFLAYATPILAMILSDFVIGFHDQWMSVYGCIFIIAVMSRWINSSLRWSRLVATSFSSSIFFFLVTNFEVWARSGMYAKNASGLIECYVMGLPFLQGTLAGDLIFTLALFGIYVFSTRRWCEPSRSSL